MEILSHGCYSGLYPAVCLLHLFKLAVQIYLHVLHDQIYEYLDKSPNHEYHVTAAMMVRSQMHMLTQSQ